MAPMLAGAQSARAGVGRSRWAGWLAPGSYDLVARMPGGELREPVIVDRNDVEHRLVR